MLFRSKKNFLFVLITLLPAFLNGMDDSLEELFKKMSVSGAPIDAEQVKIEMGMMAAKTGDLESLKHCIDSSNVNKSSLTGQNIFDAALVFAFKSKNEAQYSPLFEYLFSVKAELQRPAAGKSNSTLANATVFACCENYTKPLEILLAYGANPFTSCTKGDVSAVNLCVVSKTEKNKQPGAEAVLKLFQARATTLKQAIDSLHLEKIKELANPDSIEQSNTTSFHPLVPLLHYHKKGIKEALPIINVLLFCGANPNSELKNTPIPGMTFMHEATKLALNKGDTAILEACLEHKGNPKYQLFPLAPSCIDFVKSVAHFEPNNPHVRKVRSLLNTAM